FIPMTSGQRKIKKSFFVLIILSFLIVAYQVIFPKIPEPCFNGVFDIGEEKVDCGGVCIKRCPPPPAPPDVNEIEVEWVEFVKDGEGNYDLVAKITNKNSFWGVSSVDYTFIAYGDNNKTIRTEKNETYIMPKGFLKEEGVKYIIEDNFKPNFNVEKVDIELFNYIWKEIKDPRDLPDFSAKVIDIKNKKGEFVTDGPEFYYVYGVTKNASKYSFYRVDIDVIIYNTNDEPIAVGKTNQWTVPGGEGWEFRIFWNEPFSNDIDYIDYEAQTNVFDSTNFMKDFGTGEKYMIPR
ncbi:MAG: hypothetical protein KAS78_06590, partial [Candidatus Pacebacteria bacterium]|nr:hypothetical protein [Candidatus Paceibacterota bacterium]